MKIRPYISLLVVFFCSVSAFSQEEEIPEDTTAVKGEDVDLKYKEDQMYIGATYNILLNRPEDVKQNNLSRGIQFGIIKDMPLNKRRNIALGIGLGYAYNVHFHNLQFRQDEEGVSYGVIPDSVDYRRNKIDTHLIEMPIEFRWRTSTAGTYKFWRIYTGIKLGYVFANRYKFIADEKTKFTDDDISRFQAGLHLSVGYNTWNFYAYYGLGKLFEDGTVTDTGESLEMNSLKIGIIFYAL